jgi:mRNA-degrading endonuclease RelE of RelBE toxin-antitoxin system
MFDANIWSNAMDNRLEEQIRLADTELRSGGVRHIPFLEFYCDLLACFPPEPRVREQAELGLRSVASDTDFGPLERSTLLDHEKPQRGENRRPPPWYIGMTKSFSSAISKIDRKLQGRILEAITELAQDPMQLRGDTIKPLTGNFKNRWRYRIGDFRLVYEPDKGSGDVTLLAFAARGGAYD